MVLTHRVELSASHHELARRAQTAWLTDWEHRIAPALAAALDTVEERVGSLWLDRVVVDLGELAPDELEEIPARILAAVPRAITQVLEAEAKGRDELFEDQAGESDIERALAGAIADPSTAHAAGAALDFLLRGHRPWWAPDVHDAVLGDAIERWCTTAAPQHDALVRQLLDDPHATRRLSEQLGPGADQAMRRRMQQATVDARAREPSERRPEPDEIAIPAGASSPTRPDEEPAPRPDASADGASSRVLPDAPAHPGMPWEPSEPTPAGSTAATVRQSSSPISHDGTAQAKRFVRRQQPDPAQMHEPGPPIALEYRSTQATRGGAHAQAVEVNATEVHGPVGTPRPDRRAPDGHRPMSGPGKSSNPHARWITPQPADGAEQNHHAEETQSGALEPVERASRSETTSDRDDSGSARPTPAAGIETPLPSGSRPGSGARSSETSQRTRYRARPSARHDQNAPSFHASKPRMMLPHGERIPVQNAGLVLVWPLLPRQFRELGWRHQGEWAVDGQRRAMHWLHHLATGASNPPEHELVIAKLLCGVPLPDSVALGGTLSDAARDAARKMIVDVVHHWSALGATSPDGLRRGFLQRSGLLTYLGPDWRLQIERQAYDILLERLPWGYGTVRFRWTPYTLGVEW